MKTSRPHEVVELLRGKTLIHRTGIWLMPSSLLGHEADQAARLNVDTVDIRQPLLDGLPVGTRFLGLSDDKVMNLLTDLSDQNKGTDCILICNLDLLLARLRQQERVQTWNQLYNAFPHRKHALLIAMPESAEHLLPLQSTLKMWNSDRRLASTTPLDL